MRRLVPLLLLVVAAAAAAEPVVYRLDPEASYVHFEVLHFGTSTLRGRFGPVQGQVTLDREAGSGQVALTVAVASLSTGLKVLDNRLRERDLLNTDAFPEATFAARSFRFDNGQPVELRGDLTVRGIATGLTLKALHFACRQPPEVPREVCGGDFEGFVQRSEFGAGYLAPFVSDKVRLLVQVEGERVGP